MAFARPMRETTLLCLPEELFDDITSWLDEKEFCSMERSNRRISAILSKPCRTGPTERVLDLETLWNFEAGCEMRPRALRWFERKMKRYSQIVSDTTDPTMLEGAYNLEGATDASAPPVLPSLLDACAPSAALTLSVYPEQGDKFLAMSCAQGSSFWPNLQRHLTVLTLILSPRKGEAQLLGALGTLTALQTLSVEAECSPPLYRDLAGEKAAWELPHLTSLQMQNLEDGKLTLKCPKLAAAWFVNNKSLHITMVDAVLTTLVLTKCESTQFDCTHPEESLRDLVSLRVAGCSEVDSHVIENISLMSKLQKLTYDSFPTRSMLCTTFPQSLCDVCLYPVDWPINLPRRLKELPKLKKFTFNSEYETWQVTRPLNEFLPLDSLNSMKIGVTEYSADQLLKLKALGVQKATC